MKQLATLAVAFVLFSTSVHAGWISEGIVYGVIMEHIGIDQTWEHYDIITDCMHKLPDRDYDAELREVLSRKQLARLRQLTTQLYIQQNRFAHACQMMGLTDEQTTAAKKLAKTVFPKVPPKQLEMIFKLRREHFSLMMTDEEVAKLCGERLHLPVKRLYSGHSRIGDLHAVGVDWLKCLSNGKVGAAMSLTSAQKRKVREFRKQPRMKDFLRNQKKRFVAADKAWLTDSTNGRFREALKPLIASPEYQASSKEERRAARVKLATKFAAGRGTLDEIGVQERADLYGMIDKDAAFIVEFLESLLTPEKLLELKQRVLQSGMVLGSSGLRPALRQVGFDMYRDKEAREKFGPYSGDDYLEPMGDYVRWCAYRNVLVSVVGAPQFQKKTGERITFPSPFQSESSNFDTDLYDTKIEF